MSKLVLQNLSRRFNDFTAVDNVNLEFQDGEFVSLLGPSGCGKTTMLRMIAGFVNPTSGTIELDGTVLSSPRSVIPPEGRQMSMIFQSYAIWPNMTVSENVAFGLHVRKTPESEVKKRVQDILELVQLGHLRDRYPSELSGGQQQRVSLARAIVIRPKILLLDEPLSNLDANLREEMRFEIRKLHDEFRITTVYVTHDQSEAMVTSDRIVVMNQGHIEQIDSPFKLYAKPRTRFVASFVGRTNFLSGTISGADIQFDGFAISGAAACATQAGVIGPQVSFSVRPQSIQLHDEQQPASGLWSVPGRVTNRAYLGEYWDYMVSPLNGGAEVRVSTPPARILDIGARVWMGIDPRQATPIPD